MRKPILTLLVIGGLFASCSDDDDTPVVNELEVPENYTSFESYDPAGSEATSLTGSLAALRDYMQTGRPGDQADTDRNQLLSSMEIAMTFTNLNQWPNLDSITTDDFAYNVSNVWAEEIAAASGGVYGQDPDGGVYGSYLLDETGVDLEQIIEKGLYGAALYNYAVTVYLNPANTVNGMGATSQSVLEESWDNAFILYGADPSFPNNSNDSWSAKYAARRDNAGYYTNLKNAFLTGRAAIVEGEEFTEERNRAIADIADNWERALATTAINYLYSVKSGLLNATDEAGKSSAYHSWSEAYAFIYGFKGVDSNFRNITDVEINNILGYIHASPTTFDLDNIGDLDLAIDAIAQVYGISDPTIFQVNDVTANNR